jgi:hypothetical protein
MRSVKPTVTPKMSSVVGIRTGELDLAIRRLLSEVMSACAKDRQQVAEELSRNTGRSISVSILNDYTATTKTAARFPAAYVRGFCEITGDDSLQRFLLGPRLLALIEIGEREIEAQQNKSAKDSLMQRLLAGEGKEK